jgi:hypothetical protein
MKITGIFLEGELIHAYPGLPGGMKPGPKVEEKTFVDVQAILPLLEFAMKYARYDIDPKYLANGYSEVAREARAALKDSGYGFDGLPLEDVENARK